jgi:hypothetical protein
MIGAARLRLYLFALVLLALAMPAVAHDVTVSGNVTFASLDGSSLDHDGVANGVFTVSDGNLIVNGTINCNDDSSTSACNMSFVVSGDMTVNSGGALYAENRSGGGTGGNISLSVGGNLALNGTAIISSSARSSSSGSGGAITANVAHNVTLASGSTIDSGSANAPGGTISVVAGGTISADGNVLSGPSRTLLSTRLTGAALDGGTANAVGGQIAIRSTSFTGPAVSVGANANIISQGGAGGAGPVTIDGCGIEIRGLVASLGTGTSASNVAIRSGKGVVIDGRDLGGSGTRMGIVRADAPNGTAVNRVLDVLAAGEIDLLGPASGSFYVLNSLSGVHDSKSYGGLIRVISNGDAIVGSGNLVDDGRVASGDSGGAVQFSAKGNVVLTGATLRAFGDSSTGNPNRGGGSIAIRSYSGNISWTNGLGDVRPVGSASGLAPADQGSIVLTACGTIDTTGTSFPVLGTATSPLPETHTGVCSPAAPSLPSGVVLVTCNTPPVANSDTATTNEDNSVTIHLSGSDADGDTLTFSIVTPPAHGSLGAITPTGPTTADVVYSPNLNYNGTDSFVFQVNDGNGGTSNGTITITIVPVNDAPSFLIGPSQSVLEDSGAHTVANWATAISPGPADESSQTVTFTVTNDNNPLFSVQPAVASNGTLTYTLAANANGSATITVVAQDNGGTANGGVDTSAPQTSTITVTAVNDAPTFTGGGNVSVNEDSGAYSAAWATSISAGPADESGQTVNFVVSNDNNALFSAQPSISPSGVLTFTPAADANGTATVTVTLHDNGGTTSGGVDTSASQTFTITVNSVNDAPSFTGSGDVTVNEDSGAYSATWATAISAGPANESGQTVNFVVSNNNNALFSAQPSISPSGVLTFTPAADANGTATVTVTLNDDGGTSNGGVDASASQTFTITVNAVNDAPSFVKGPDINVTSTDGPQTFANWATSISAGPANESGQSVTFTVTNDNNGVFLSQPAVSPGGTLTFNTDPAAPTTVVHVTVVIHDNGGTANGGVDTSAPQTFVINITHGNQTPVANGDSFSAVGNTELRVGTGSTITPALVTAGSVLGNDSDADGPSPISVSAFDATSLNGGSISMNANGTFNYLPPTGFTGVDVFHYTITDGAATATAAVTVTVSNRVWYVNGTAVGTQSGRSTEPFSTLAQAESASAANDFIHVAQGTYIPGITLKNGQHLVGSGVPLVVGAFTLAPATVRPIIGTITLASGDVVTGLNVNVSSAAVGITGSGILGGTIDGVNVTGGFEGVDLISTLGTFTLKDVGITLSGAGLTISGGGATINASNLDITTTGGKAIVGNAGTLNISAGADGSTVSTTGATAAVDLSNMTLGVSLLSLSESGGATNAVNLSNTLGSFAVTGSGAAGSGGTITGTTGVSVNAVNASGVSLQWMAINNSALQGVLVNNNLTTASSVTVKNSSFSGNFSNAVQTVNANTGAMTVTADANTFVNNNAAVIVQTTKGPLTTKITNNVATFNQTAPFAVARSTGGNSLTEATITGNTVGTSGVPNSGATCGGGCNGINVTVSGTNVFNLLISNNSIHQVDAIGIRVIANQGSSALNSTITNNVIDQPVAGALFGINVQSGSLTADTTAVCAGITGNVVSGGWATDIFVRNVSAGSTFSLPGYAGLSTDTTAVANFLIANNTITTALAQRKTTAPQNGFSGGSPCTLPAP